MKITTSFPVHTIESAPADSQPLLEGAESAFSFVPNLLAGMAEAPAMLEGYMTLSGIFNKTNLSETERQIILMTNNRLNGCTYCMAAHTSLSQMGGVEAEVIESLRSGTPIADTKLEALRTFTARVNKTRGWLEQSDLDPFFAAGYTKQTVFEVILGTSLKVLSNYTNHVVNTPVDETFAPNTWSSETVAPAASLA